MYVIIDNYDSFTYNLFQYLSSLTDREVRVFRNDRVTIAELEQLPLSGLIISPGPGRPENAGVSVEVVRHFAGRVPILGVCLGHQVIGAAFGGQIVAAGEIVHGKTDQIELDGRGLFRGIPSPAVFTRYHSLIIDRDSVPDGFEVTARIADGEVMGIRHHQHVIEGVQFHPESIASEHGMRMLANFVDYKREPFAFTPALAQVMRGDDLSMDAAAEIMDELTEGRLPESQTAAILVGLAMKGLQPEEVAGLASVLKRKKRRIEHEQPVLDTCGTGGDGLATFNISSLAALVAAGCGARVAKHGNRGVSSPTGSAEFYGALGVEAGLTPEQASQLLGQAGFAFLFAPTYHSAMRHAAPVRAQLGVKTVMNLLGPLANPAEAEYQLIGVFDGALCETVARAARLLGVRRVMVVHGDDGQDEISVTGPSRIVEIGEDDQLVEQHFDPARCGIEPATLDDLRGGTAAENAAIAGALLAGGGPPAIRDAVALNAGAGLYVFGTAPDLCAGYQMAREALANGAAAAKLEQVTATIGSLLGQAAPAPVAGA